MKKLEKKSKERKATITMATKGQSGMKALKDSTKKRLEHRRSMLSGLALFFCV
jgi:hypothetical protein